MLFTFGQELLRLTPHDGRNIGPSLLIRMGILKGLQYIPKLCDEFLCPLPVIKVILFQFFFGSRVKIANFADKNICCVIQRFAQLRVYQDNHQGVAFVRPQILQIGSVQSTCFQHILAILGHGEMINHGQSLGPGLQPFDVSKIFPNFIVRWLLGLSLQLVPTAIAGCYLQYNVKFIYFFRSHMVAQRSEIAAVYLVAGILGNTH